MKRTVLFLLLVMIAIHPVAFAQDSDDTLRLVTLVDVGNFNPVFQVNSLITRLTWEGLYRADG